MSIAVQTDVSDQDARNRIEQGLDATIFVEAGAGSGKTRALVNRVLALIDQGIDVTGIVAITFTDRAAAELRDRIRRALRDSIAGSEDQATRELRETALAEIDDAAFGTLHGFARRLLAEHPIEAGLPINFQVRDEVTSSIYESSAWAQRSAAIRANPELIEDIRIAASQGVRLSHIRELGESLDVCWDRVTQELFYMPGPIDPQAYVDQLAKPIERYCGFANECHDDTDPQLERMAIARGQLEELRAAGSAKELIDLLSGGFSEKFDRRKVGRKTSWDFVDKVRDAQIAVLDAYNEAKLTIFETAVRRLVCAIASEVVRAAEDRCKAGLLTFDDLLVLARKLLVENPGGVVRRQLHERYTHVLLDEFQDTDPLQLDLALRLTADPADDSPLAELSPLPGRLFTVGDPKQSIYAFRRADLALYLAVRERMTDKDEGFGELQSLVVNFRTVGSVIDWVNSTFDRVIEEQPHSQPDYEELKAHRGDRGLLGSAVVQLGREAHEYGTKSGELREHEARDIAGVICEAVGAGDSEHWEVERADGSKEPTRLEDIAILLPTRTSLDQITDALDAAAIPYRTESSGLVYAAAETRALITTLRAIDDPDDELSLVVALRSMLFGCGDDDLFRYKVENGGRWRTWQDVSDFDPDDPVVEALTFLKGLADRAHALSPAAILEEIVQGRRLLELGQLDSRPRDLWRRVRFVIDQARAWSAGGGTTLSDYIVWAESQMDESARVNEAILPETDDDAVRLLTVHGSKGLEFPVVIVAGLAGQKAKTRSEGRVAVSEDDWDISIGSKLRTGEFADAESERDRDLDERKRLLYVACTRARDHLVVSTHRAESSKGGSTGDAAWIIADAAPAEGVEFFSAAGAPTLGEAAARPVDDLPLPAQADWQERLGRAREASGAASAVSVTSLGEEDLGAGSLEVEIVSVVGGDRSKLTGRRGAAYGSAVHEVMQRIALDRPEDAEFLAAQACSAAGIPDAVDAVSAAARAILAAPAVTAAAGKPCWREMWICDEVDGVLVEGVIDLMYEGDDGLVIVDFKTNPETEAEFAEAAGAYRTQVARYVQLVEKLTGRAVARGVLVHVGTGA